MNKKSGRIIALVEAGEVDAEEVLFHLEPSGKRCGATTKKGKRCKGQGLGNGLCVHHGGLEPVYTLIDQVEKKVCGARRKKDGLPCQAKAMANGRCKYHGGESTGPKTMEGKARALANLKQNG